MADIAFLLLVFFLLVTTLDVEQGIITQLSKPSSVTEKYAIIQTDLWLNEDGSIMVNGALAERDNFQELLSNQYDPKPNVKNVLMLTCETEVDYYTFVETLDKAKNSFLRFQNKIALHRFGKQFDEIDAKEKAQLLNEHPIVLAENVMPLY